MARLLVKIVDLMHLDQLRRNKLKHFVFFLLLIIQQLLELMI